MLKAPLFFEFSRTERSTELVIPPISNEEFERLLADIETSKATDLDGIPSYFIKVAKK